ncbi:uncharacterized protein LOC131665518 [Phymastichus coffea]|uniref:uncharacterized protein LOC131665518 n=1 Tax=Phymastichus coffea TaxID=108790 RepID=UPI00273CCB7D|nr:uncharacterized protein LOC131665518 [Phymastichus coffea]
MKTTVADPWSSVDSCGNSEEVVVNNVNKRPDDDCFEDSFVLQSFREELEKLPDSEEYLARLQSRLEALKGGTSKRDLINSLSIAKEECIARLITGGHNLEISEEQELAANPVIRHIAPHLQALTANELVHLLKADVLQAVVDEQNKDSESQDSESKLSDNLLDIQIQDSKEN